MRSLKKLESRLQSLLEMDLLKYLPGYKTEDKVIQQLAAAMQNNLKERDGVAQAPDVYVVVVPPSALSRWESEAPLVETMANALLTAGTEAGFRFANRPTVTTAADANLPSGKIRVIASFRPEAASETISMPAEKKTDRENAIPTNAFLILGGTKIFPLKQSVVNIGRRLDNQIVIDDPRVSRAHAQLRFVKGRFMLFDLNSTGGTFVNGERIHQSVLQPGDVISLAGITLVFGQDIVSESPAEDAPTKPTAAVSADQPTEVPPEGLSQ